MNTELSPIQLMYLKLEKMSDNEILYIWKLLSDYDPLAFYSDIDKISMDDFAYAVDFERSKRGLSVNGEEK